MALWRSPPLRPTRGRRRGTTRRRTAARPTRGDVVPLLQEECQHDELGVLAAGRRTGARRHVDLIAATIGRPSRGRQPAVRCAEPPGRRRASDVDVRVLVDDRDGLVGQLAARLGVNPAAGAQDARRRGSPGTASPRRPPPAADPGSTASSPGSWPSREARPPRLRRRTGAPTRRTARPHPGPPRRRRRRAPPGWRSASAAARDPRSAPCRTWRRAIGHRPGGSRSRRCSPRTRRPGRP